MKKLIYILAGTLISLGSIAQSKPEQRAIRNLCGCFEVEFMYAETFAADTSYVFRPRYHVSGLEWVVAEEATDRKFVLQHLLIAGDSLVIKHWREDWEYEKSDWWMFDHDAAWNHVTGDRKTTKGQWTQTVWEVDDAPRYQGSGQWLLNNDKYYWENTTDAPLPRREYTERHDYNVMQRTNRIIATDSGWVHEQDNRKLVRQEHTTDVFLAGEKGFNIYRRTNNSTCRQAEVWWQRHRIFWATVRASWEEVMLGRSRFQLTAKLNDRFLYQDLDDLEQQALTGEALKEKIKDTLIRFSK